MVETIEFPDDRFLQKEGRGGKKKRKGGEGGGRGGKGTPISNVSIRRCDQDSHCCMGKKKGGEEEEEKGKIKKRGEKRNSIAPALHIWK